MERYPNYPHGGHFMNGNGACRGDLKPPVLRSPQGGKEAAPGMSAPEKKCIRYEGLQLLSPAMAYVPVQEYTTAFDLGYGLKVGTIFPELCKPFCGKGGKMR